MAELDLNGIPDTLRDVATRRWRRVADVLGEERVSALLASSCGAALPKVLAVSEFVARTLCRWPDLAQDWAVSGAASRVRPSDSDLDALLERPEAEVMAALRRIRQCGCASIAYRDLSGEADLDTTLADLSALADACLLAAIRWARRDMLARFGLPRDEAGMEQHLVVLAMGKLGGGELNFSSDIDLIFCFPRSGETDGERRESNEQYFVRQVQRVVHLLDTPTADGFVYRTDVRLRPFGDSGPLVLSFAAMEQYYQQHGRDWERYAMIKARAVGEDAAACDEIQTILKPFVYRRYLDYGAFDALREMKARVDAEAARRDLAGHVKLGRGGIREIEFIAQTFQLIRGGRVAALRDRRLQSVLACLRTNATLPVAEVDALVAAYRLLRDLENRIQMMDDAQAHDLPQEPLARSILALAMGADDWGALVAALDQHRDAVAGTFARLVVNPRAGSEHDEPLAAWIAGGAVIDTEGRLPPGIDRDSAELLSERLVSGRLSQLDAEGRRRLQRLLPAVLRVTAAAAAPQEALRRTLDVLERIGRRSAYFALLTEQPAALDRLVQRCAESRWIADQIAEAPLLLDELIDLRGADRLLDRAALADALSARLAAVSDLEDQLDILRQFRSAQTFRIAQAELDGALPLMRISDRLSDLAEIMLQSTLAMARRELGARGPTDDSRFLVAAYGKLGGLELGYTSDLDLVFLYDAPGDPLEAQPAFLRLAQKLVHLMATPTVAGVLYTVDMRLRPSGNSGLLVSHLPAFQRYQSEEAWSWEHQALLRSRPVAGDTDLAARFTAVRRDVLCAPRDPLALARGVLEMRERLRDAAPASEQTSIKQVPGGLMDLEFLVQYHCLANAADHPEVIAFSDNIRQLEALASAGLLPSAEADRMIGIYLDYRGWMHRRDLDLSDHGVADGRFAEERDWLATRWRERLLAAASA
jgi:[glutamine synthetase] adenylyltransferase / [glutamine synthetase]-adenylyl-L-tyrosine phosphorylase